MLILLLKFRILTEIAFDMIYKFQVNLVLTAKKNIYQQKFFLTNLWFCFEKRNREQYSERNLLPCVRTDDCREYYRLYNYRVQQSNCLMLCLWVLK